MILAKLSVDSQVGAGRRRVDLTITVGGVGSVAAGSLFKWSGSSFVAAIAGTDDVAPGSTYDPWGA